MIKVTINKEITISLHEYATLNIDSTHQYVFEAVPCKKFTFGDINCLQTTELKDNEVYFHVNGVNQFGMIDMDSWGVVVDCETFKVLYVLEKLIPIQRFVGKQIIRPMIIVVLRDQITNQFKIIAI